jgi:hypothetical protein
MANSDLAAIGRGGLSRRRARLKAQVNQRLRTPLEALESRVHLTAATSSSSDLHNLQSGPLAKVGHNLANLYFNYHSAKSDETVRAFVASTDAETSGQTGLDIEGNDVGVTLVTNGNLSSFETQMEALGFQLQTITPQDDAIGGLLPIGLISQVAQTPGVIHVTPLLKPQAHAAPDQADAAMNAIGARTADNLTGAGVTVGVISDSVNQYGGGLSESVAAGNLPTGAAVQVIQDGQPGDTDEGRAILEEVHALAPGAKLIFDTSGDSQQSMATAITTLQDAGCNVIIDDIGFQDEPFFQPGVIDAAINSAVAAGVTYVTAAGNSGNAGFEQAATFVSANDGSGDQLINFDAAGSTPQTMMPITIGGTGPGDITLEWDDPYDGVTGNVHADLNIFLYSADGRQIEDESTDDTFQTGVPVQTMVDVAPGNYQVQIVAVNTPQAQLPGYYEFVGSDSSDLQSAIDSFTTGYKGTTTAVVGHSAFSQAISTGAVNFSDAPAYSNKQPLPTESYSSSGPALEARDANGTLLATPVVEQVPNVSGVDNNNTSFFIPGNIESNDPTSYPQFSGTSSAAGNLAGVVALLKQAVPTASPAQIESALETTAIPTNGAAAGTWNASGGYGLVDAEKAVTALQNATAGGGGSGGGTSGGSGGTTGTGPAAKILAISPNPRSTPVTTIDIDFNEPVAGFSTADLSLTLNGGANLLTSSQTLSTTNNEDYILTGLTPVTTGYGVYSIVLNPAKSTITGSDGKTLTSGASASWVTEAVTGLPVTPTALTATAVSSSQISLSWVEPTGNGLQEFILERSTNSSFSGKVITFHIHSPLRSFSNQGLEAGTVYYYRIETINFYGTSAFSHAATVITYNTDEVIMDTNSPGALVVGDWSPSTSVGGYEGTNYLEDGDSAKGQDYVKFHPDLPVAGDYDIYATWTASANRATKVPFDIYSKSGDLLATVRVNERKQAGAGFVYLGTYFLHSSTASIVRIRNAGTTGDVVANAIKLEPAGDIERNDVPLAPLDTPQPRASATATAALASQQNKNSEIDVLRSVVS